MAKKNEYNHIQVEKNTQKKWTTTGVYKTQNNSKKKPYYVLDMFPYPSGQGLHVGHPRGYIGSDVFARFKRMQGYNVLHPMGFDAFGLPAEQYAIQTGKHPKLITNQAIKNFKKQLAGIGFSYDWDREVQTIDPEYYKWTQYIFLQIYNSFFDTKKQKARHIDELVDIFEKEGNSKANEYTAHSDIFSFSKTQWKNFSLKERQDVLMKYRLAYEGYAEVNWCKELGTVLANDEVLEKNGKLVSERGDFPVEKKSMRQWFMRITAYGDRLLSGLDLVDFPESTKDTQRNWIGRSEGSEIEFKINTPKQKILIGTRNEAKFRMTVESFPKDISVEFLSLNDVVVDDSSLVEGQDFEENAKIKSEFYFKKTGIPTIALDNVLWIKKWPKDDGVMIHMRKEANPLSLRATDEEVIYFLQNWLDGVGGESEARFKYALAYTNEQGTDCFSSTQRKYILQKKQGKNFWAGYPTEALLVDAKTGEYKGDQDNSVRYDAFIKDLAIYSRKWFQQKDKNITVFTTRADTLFGVTYVVLAPEHALVSELLPICENKHEVDSYITEVKNKTQEERTESKEKTGVELKGVYAVNSANGEQVPVWIADYVLASYGTGAVMAVPAHDERDFEFAKKYGLSIKNVIDPVFVRSDAIGRNDFKKKNKIVSIVEDLEGNILSVNWGNLGGRLFLGGTIEEGELPEKTALRELAEESGYIDAEVVDVGDEVFDYKYFAMSKATAYQAYTKYVHIKLRSLKQKEVSLEEDEKGKFVIEWISKDRAQVEVTDPLHVYAFKKFVVKTSFNEDGIVGRSGNFNGMTSEQARKEITKFVGGKFVTKYKMRDAIFARQRYWGEPIPLIHTHDGLIVPENSLPLVLPNVKSYKPTQTGESPLASIDKWITVSDPLYDKSKAKYLIFDFDGVLGDTYDLNIEGRIAAGWAKDKQDSIEKTHEYFSKRPHHARGHTYSKSEIDELVHRCQLFGQVIYDGGIPLFDGFVKEIKKINNAKIAVVSSGVKKYVVPGMRKSGIKCDGIQTYEDSLSKEDKIEFFAKKWNVPIKDIYYFTDANSDVYELENSLDKTKIIGCAWGYLGKKELLKTLPENQILNRFTDIHKIFEPKLAFRETNTMPGWAGSSWYFLRYMDPQNKKALVGDTAINYWKNVDMYVGGAEHNTGHLLYARFWHKVLFDLGITKTEEPFKALRHQGMIGGADGRKMSKRWGNVINPDDVVKTYGADTLRVFEMFLGPFEAHLPWSEEGIIGSRRFVERVWRLYGKVQSHKTVSSDTKYQEFETVLHKTIKKVTEDIETFNFNTAISSMMICLNEMEKQVYVLDTDYKKFLQILAPFASHMTEHLWSLFGEKNSIHVSPWPVYDVKKLVSSTASIAVQINGKTRGIVIVPSDSTEEQIKKLVYTDPRFTQYLEGKEIKKIIYITLKLISFVV